MSGPNLHYRTAVAGGAIRRSRVVYTIGEYLIGEMSTNLSQPPAGIAMEHTRCPPGTPFDTSLQIGFSGDEVPYYGPGAEGRAECGGTVTAGKLQTVDSTARIVDATGSPPFSFHCVFEAKESGSAGDVVRGIVLGR